MLTRRPVRAALTAAALSLTTLSAAVCGTAAGAVPSATSPAPTDDVQPLERAHAHNDYEHERPLLDALSHGFRSVEADVWLVDGELCIGHDAPDCSRTLRSLYLRPLAQIARDNGGSVHEDSRLPLRLYVDVKSGGAAVWDVLADQLSSHPRLVTSWTQEREHTRAVEVVVSGQLANRTFDDRLRWAASDGRIVTPVPADATSADVTVVSDNWTKLFTWQGVGPMPEVERARLHRIVDEAHAEGFEVRFWATPDTEPTTREAVWRELVDAGVDQVNTDHLTELASFLKAYDPTER